MRNKATILFLALVISGNTLRGQVAADSSTLRSSLVIYISANSDTRTLPSWLNRNHFRFYPFYGFSLGAFARTPFSDNFSLQTGLSIISLGYRAVWWPQPFPSQYTTSMSIPLNVPVQKVTIQSHDFLTSIPISASYHYGKKNWKHTLSLGTSLDLWMIRQGKSVTLNENGEKETTTINFNYLENSQFGNFFNLGFFLSLSFETLTKKGYILHLIPELKVYSLIHFDDNDFGNPSYPISLGIKLAISKS